MKAHAPHYNACNNQCSRCCTNSGESAPSGRTCNRERVRGCGAGELPGFGLELNQVVVVAKECE